MTVTALERPGALGILKIEERDAWTEYLSETRDQSLLRYEELEPWAWARLNQRLLAIHARRRAILEEDGA